MGELWGCYCGRMDGQAAVAEGLDLGKAVCYVLLVVVVVHHLLVYYRVYLLLYACFSDEPV